MNTAVCRETIGATVTGVLLWAAFRQSQEFAPKKGESAGCYFLTAPSWLSFICGRPLPENRLELGLTLGQIGAVLMSISWLPMAWLGLSHAQRVVIYSTGCLSTVIVFVIMRVAVMLVSRLR
jgi:hypothetical protein